MLPILSSSSQKGLSQSDKCTLLAHWAWNSWSCLNVKGTGKHVQNLQYEQNCIALQSNGLELGLLCSRCMNGTIPEKLWSMILPQRVAEKIHLKDKLLSIKQYLVLVLTFHAKRWTTPNWLLIEDKKLIWTFGKWACLIGHLKWASDDKVWSSKTRQLIVNLKYIYYLVFSVSNDDF